MRKTLEDLYYGNISPFQRQMMPDSGLKRAVDRVAQYENQLTEQLDESGQTILTKFVRSQHDINSITALVALLWDDLDLEKQTLTISKSAGRINGEVKVTQPKTANSVRTIYLPKETVDLLIQEHAKHPSNPVMFPSPVTGKLYGPDCIGRLHKTLLKKAGITENIPFHGLRHTFATLAIQNGVDAKTVSSILGHYSAGFTLDTYTHVTGEMQKDAAQRMGSFMAQTV